MNISMNDHPRTTTAAAIMAQFPQELIEHVAFYADGETRKNMVTVSPSFQAAVERHVFDKMSLKSKDLRRFQTLYHGHRARILHSIVFTIKFPKLENTDDEDEPLPCRESLEDIQSIDEFFTRHIKQLFDAVKALEERSTSTMDGISLTIRVTRPMDYNKEAHHCDHRRWPCWRLHLLDPSPSSLPPLASIRSLSFQDAFPSYDDDWGGERSRHLDMRALLDLAAHLPNLDRLSTPGPLERFPVSYLREEVTECRRVWEGPWRDTRLGFAAAAAAALNPHSLPLGTLTTLKLHFFAADQASMCDQARPLPDLTDGSLYDPLSAALHALSLNLVSLDLRAVVDPSLFWPPPAAAAAAADSPLSPPPCWPRLRRLKVEFHNTTPDGQWYFTGPRGDADPERGFPIAPAHYAPLGPDPHPGDAAWDYYWSYLVDDLEPDVFRVRPNAARVEPLLLAFGSALGCMPRLEAAEVFTFVGWSPRGEEREREGEEWFGEEEVRRFRNGFVHRWGVGVEVGREQGRRGARVRWEVGGWRVGEDVGRALRGSLGEEGVEVEEVWVPFVLRDRRREEEEEEEEGSGWG